MFKRNGTPKRRLPYQTRRKLVGTLKLLSLLILASTLTNCVTTRGTATRMNLKQVLRPVCVPPIRYSASKDTAETVHQIRVRNQTCKNLGVTK